MYEKEASKFYYRDEYRNHRWRVMKLAGEHTLLDIHFDKRLVRYIDCIGFLFNAIE